tara:strand:- start:1704 stop:2678 length:975 start_codon:yes stop_codon:yes gene_type:complete
LRNNQIQKLLILLVFLVSCGTQKSKDYSNVSGSMVVDWNSSNERVVPKIEEKATQSGLYGPVASEEPTQVISNDTVVPMALILGPGGYRALGYLSLLKELKLRNEKPHLLMGHGMGAIVASYFAFGYKSDYIEWKFFKFTKKAKDLEIYSEAWLEVVREVLIDDLLGKKIEEGRLTLMIPVFSKKLGKVTYLKRGQLTEALMANVDLLDHISSEYEPAFYQEILSPQALTDLGIGKVMVVNLLKDGINWKKGRGLLNGYFQKTSQLLDEVQFKEKVIMEYSLGRYPLDDLSGVADLLYKSKELSRKKISEYILSKNKTENANQN